MIHVRPMTSEDLALGLRLSRQAGWNQTAADWARLLALEPDGGLIAELDGLPVATLTTCVFGPVAWIAMVLVDPAARGQGVGKALVGRALDGLDGLGVRTVRLDATPMGEPLYRRLGFVAEYTLARFLGTPTPAGPAGLAWPFEPAMREPLLALDRRATGTDRAKLLTRLIADFPEEVRVVGGDGEIDGYVMTRPGTRAEFLGPCIASPEAGPKLLTEAWSRSPGRATILDVPTAHPAATSLAHARGLTVSRHLLRMRRGDPVAEQPSWLWASSGPEKG